jgi:hypothetical protein
MAPKETKKDRERRLKKAEELTTATDAPTDAPTEGLTQDDDNPDEGLLYDAKGGLISRGPRKGREHRGLLYTCSGLYRLERR